MLAAPSAPDGDGLAIAFRVRSRKRRGSEEQIRCQVAESFLPLHRQFTQRSALRERETTQFHGLGCVARRIFLGTQHVRNMLKAPADRLAWNEGLILRYRSSTVTSCEGIPIQTVMQMRFVGIELLAFLLVSAIGHSMGQCGDPFSDSTARPITGIREVSLPLVAGNQPVEEIELLRYKKQAIQSISVEAGGVLEFEQSELNSTYLDVGIGTGIPLGSFDNILGVTPRFRVDWIDAAPVIDIPQHLYEFELQFFYRRPIRDRLSLLAIVSPSIRSDLTTSDKAFRVFALGLVNWEYIPDRLTISGGAVVLGRADLPVLPAVGIVWTPNRRIKLDLRFPLTKLSYRIAKQGGQSEMWAYVSGGIGGNTWAVTRATEQTDELSLRDYRLCFGVERLISGGGGCFAECGVAVGRRLEYERDDTEIRFDDAAILRAGWRY